MPGLFDRLFSRNGHARPKLSASVQTVPLRIRAKYDAAQDTTDNANYWAQADLYSADVSMSSAVREKLRKRARLEVENSSYAKGILLTLANDLIGTGPTLQLQTENAGFNGMVERLFREWAQSVRLAEKLRVMVHAKKQDGEAFAIMASNPNAATPVLLDLKLIEAEQVATPFLSLNDPQVIDGIHFDAFDNPVSYDVLRYHPGGNSWQANLDADNYPARYVIHWFRRDRPGQHRGVPEITPALPLFAKLRNYTDAVIAAAQTAADIAAVCQTDMPPSGEADLVTPLDTVPLERRVMTTLPMGWTLAQLKAEQPTTVYGDFVSKIVNELGRCVNMPLNIAACDSSKYNYASGRLDHQTYFRSLRVEQSDAESSVLDRIFPAWFREAALVNGWQDGKTAPPRQWNWPGNEHVDPEKEANAQRTRLESHTTTFAREYAREGLDWEAELQQRAKEIKLLKQLDLLVDFRSKQFSDPTKQAAANAGSAKPKEKDDGEA